MLWKSPYARLTMRRGSLVHEDTGSGSHTHHCNARAVPCGVVIFSIHQRTDLDWMELKCTLQTLISRFTLGNLTRGERKPGTSETVSTCNSRESETLKNRPDFGT